MEEDEEEEEEGEEMEEDGEEEEEEVVEEEMVSWLVGDVVSHWLLVFFSVSLNQEGTSSLMLQNRPAQPA